MHFMAFYVDGREGSCRTQVLTGTTAYATVLVDSRYVGRCLVVWVAGHHLDGANRTVAGTVAALYPIGQWNTVLLNPYGMTYLGGYLVFMLQRQNGSCWTYL